MKFSQPLPLCVQKLVTSLLFNICCCSIGLAKLNYIHNVDVSLGLYIIIFLV